MKDKNLIVTLTGPSCAGKTTLEGMMIERLGFERVISTTTRQPRENEKNGDSYYFMTKSQFKRMEEQGAFVEAVEFNGERYGVSVSEFERVFETGKPVVIVVEPNGQKQVAEYAKEVDWNVYSVFISNPQSVIAERFLKRFSTEVTAWSDGISDDSLATYSNRLAVMMTTEMGWQFEAAHGNIYNLRAWEFNEINAAEIVGAIEKYAVNGEEVPQLVEVMPSEEPEPQALSPLTGELIEEGEPA